jgi:hypothetical protein
VKEAQREESNNAQRNPLNPERETKNIGLLYQIDWSVALQAGSIPDGVIRIFH